MYNNHSDQTAEATGHGASTGFSGFHEELGKLLQHKAQVERQREQGSHESAGRTPHVLEFTNLFTKPNDSHSSNGGDQSSHPHPTTAEAGEHVTSAPEKSHFVLPIGANNPVKDVNLKAIDKPDANLPDVWNHPESSKLDGKCGITGVANMLRFYGVEKDPKDIDKREYRSWGPGMRSDKFADDMTKLSGKKFHSGSLDDGQDPLQFLRDQLKDGKPVAIQYMTGSTNAHWVVVTGITEGKDGPELQVQSWGQYHQVPFKDIQDQWKRGYGGDYPYVVGDEPSDKLKKK